MIFQAGQEKAMAFDTVFDRQHLLAAIGRAVGLSCEFKKRST